MDTRVYETNRSQDTRRLSPTLRCMRQDGLATILTLTWEPPYQGKTVFILRQGPGVVLKWLLGQFPTFCQFSISISTLTYSIPCSYSMGISTFLAVEGAVKYGCDSRNITSNWQNFINDSDLFPWTIYGKPSMIMIKFCMFFFIFLT